RPRRPGRLEGVGQAVDDALGGPAQVPQQMAGKPRAVVEDAEQDRRHPLALRREHLARAMMRIEVEKTADVLGLVAPDLAVEEAGFRALGALGAAGCKAGPSDEAAGLEEAAQRGIGGEGEKGGVALG